MEWYKFPQARARDGCVTHSWLSHQCVIMRAFLRAAPRSTPPSSKTIANHLRKFFKGLIKNSLSLRRGPELYWEEKGGKMQLKVKIVLSKSNSWVLLGLAWNAASSREQQESFPSSYVDSGDCQMEHPKPGKPEYRPS